MVTVCLRSIQLKMKFSMKTSINTILKRFFFCIMGGGWYTKIHIKQTNKTGGLYLIIKSYQNSNLAGFELSPIQTKL